jgi:hypothetical protein
MQLYNLATLCNPGNTAKNELSWCVMIIIPIQPARILYAQGNHASNVGFC